MGFLPEDYNLRNNWQLIKTPFAHADFVTHLNYLEHMSVSSQGIKLNFNRKIIKRIDYPRQLNLKLKLLELTFNNINEEKKNIDNIHEYAVVCVSWIPVKSYYLIFNLLIILEYLIIANESIFNTTHGALFTTLKRLLSNKELSYNNKHFNKIYLVAETEQWNMPKWSNVRSGTSPLLRYKQIIKILARYAKEDYKRNHNVKRLAGKNKQEFESKTTINLTEFLYWYRIKANYRDMEFVDSGVEVGDFYQFYNYYYGLTMQLYTAYRECVNQLSLRRLGVKLIKN